MAATTAMERTRKAELLHWDSEFWNVRVGRANYSAALDEWARANTVGVLCLLIPAADVEDCARAEANGARLVDVRVQLDIRLTPYQAPESWIRPFRSEEVEDLAPIARTAFRGVTRFYADPRFADVRCDDLYENWLRSSCEGWAAQVLVAPERGFVTIHRDGDEASIGLIAVDEAAQRRGVGVSLTRAATYWAAQDGAKRMTVVTQGRNLAAQRTFQRAGFLTCDTSLWFHKWFGGKPSAPPLNPSNKSA